MLRHLHLWAHALPAYVDVDLLAVVSGEFLCLWRYLSCVRHGLNDTVDGTALSVAPLLYDLSDVYLQRLSAELRMVRLLATDRLCLPSDVHHQ